MNRNHLFLVMLTLLAVLLTACGAPTPATPASNSMTLPTSEPATVLEAADPESIARDFYEAVNAGDIEAAMALVAENVKCRGACYLTGKTSFQSYIQGTINMGGRVELSDLKVDGEKVAYTWTAYNTDNLPVALGSESLQIQNGLIVLMETQLGVAPAANVSDPISIVSQFYELLNAKEVAKAMELTADDYIMNDPFGTYDRAAAAIQWQSVVDAGLSFNQTDFKDTGNGRVTSCYEVFQDGISIDKGCGNVTHIRDGKIIFDGLEPAEQIWIVQKFYELLNAKDVDRAMELTASDYVMNDPFGTYDREAAAQQWNAVVQDAGLSFNQTNFTNTGNGRVTSCYEVFQNGSSIDKGCGNVTHIRDGRIIFDGLENAEQIWIVQNYYEALNTKNLDLAMTFIAPEALFINPTGTYEGADAVRESLVGLNMDGITFDLSKFRNEGGKIVYDYKVMQSGNLLDQGTNGLTVVEDGLVIFDGTEDTFVAR